MSDLIAAQIKEVGMKMCHSFRFQPLLSKFMILSFVPISLLCLILIKLYKFVLLIFQWLRRFECHFENPTILVIGPQNDIVQEIIAQLSRKFNSKIFNLQDRNAIKRSMSKQNKTKSKVIYSNAPITSQEVIIEMSKFVQSTFDFVDILIIAQNENSVENDSTHSFLTHLNRQLLANFWTVMAFLPGMLQRNSGYIISIALGKSTLINTGIIRSIHDELLQCTTNVKMALIENNSKLENYLPLVPTDLKAKLIIKSMWNFDSVVKVPSLPMYILMLPVLFIQCMKTLIVKSVRFTSDGRF